MHGNRLLVSLDARTVMSNFRREQEVTDLADTFTLVVKDPTIKESALGNRTLTPPKFIAMIWIVSSNIMA